jgi:hypothetical protein
VETLRAAILHLADKARRSKLAMSLLMHLPDLVAEGRHLDGWLIQQCAYDTGELAGESNPFLFELFSYGYDAWAAEQHRQGEGFLRELGMDPERLRRMSAEEIDAWLRAQEADPRQKARMAELIEAHPEQRAIAAAGLEKAERDFVELLGRAHARQLLLAPEEVEPWLPVLLDRFQAARDSCPELSDDDVPRETASRAFADAIAPALREMAQSIFTPERTVQLIARLREYRNERFAAGDLAAAAATTSAITSLEHEGHGDGDYFLTALCFASVRALGPSGTDSDAADEDASQPGEPAG